MSGFFFNLGRSLGSTVRQSNWLLESLTGTDADALQAEQEVGADLARTILTEMPRDEHPEVARFLNECGALLTAPIRHTGRTFQYWAVQSEEVNAFALPGGYVVATLPLLELCRWDAHEVSFVLSHEMGHIVLGHTMQRIMQGLFTNVAGRLMPLRGLVGGLVFSQAAELVSKAHAREAELDADAFGLRLVHSAGLDAHGAIRLLARLAAGTTPADPPLAYFATHPPFAERLAQIHRCLAGKSIAADSSSR